MLKCLTWPPLKTRGERENTQACLLKLSFISGSSHVFHLGTYRSLGAERTLCHARPCGPRKISGLRKFLLFRSFLFAGEQKKQTEEVEEEEPNGRPRRRRSCKGIRPPRIRNDKVLTKHPHVQTAKGKRGPPPLRLSNSATSWRICCRQ